MSSSDLENGASRSSSNSPYIYKLSWDDVSVTVKDWKTRLPRRLVGDVSGDVRGGKTAPVRRIELLHKTIPFFPWIGEPEACDLWS